MTSSGDPVAEGMDARTPAPPPRSAGSNVDVIITTRNEAPGLTELVDRLRDEDIHDLFIVDDGSTEYDAVRALDRFEAAGYHVVRQDPQGSGRARNEGVRVSRAPFLVHLEVGMLPREGFLTEASTRMDDDSTIAAVVADGPWHGDGDRMVVSELDPASLVAAVQFEPFALLRRAAIEKAGGWDERLESGQDRDLFLTLAETGWSFANVRSIGVTQVASANGEVSSPRRHVTPADGFRIAEKHHELIAAHLSAVIGAYESALVEAGTLRSNGRDLPGRADAVHDLIDQLAAVRADLARSQADGVRARSIVADVDAARLEVERRAEQAQADLEERIAALDRELAAIYALKSHRLLKGPRRIYALVRVRLRR
jgi:Glycosyl transferase family 2